ncbi:hypothetical protein EZS27_019766 [termite gut metagenome]|uniref:Type II toxin-antitoxin system RelE/ParE family toxin n=1 Tax=termite gut metagenome TaxID=433724 RepID=A0A5J4RC50_9ZZZZ
MVVEWSDPTTEDFDNIVRYLENNWNDKVVGKFIRNIREEILRLAVFPFAFPVTHRKKNVRRCVVSKTNSIYYSVKENIILIFAISDNR